MIPLPGDLLKSHRRIEAFQILMGTIRGENEMSDRIALEYALFAVGLLPTSTEVLARLCPQEPDVPLKNLDDYLPTLLELSRTSPFQKIRAIAVNSLPNLNKVGPRYGAPATLSDLAARAIYTAKLGEFEPFAALLNELQSQASRTGSSVFIKIPPLTLSYLVDHRGPCIEIGPGGMDQGQRFPMTVRELFDLLRVPPEQPAEQQVQRFEAVIGNLQHRRHY